MGLCGITEGGSAGLCLDSCRTGRNAASLGCMWSGYKGMVKIPSCLVIHSGEHTHFTVGSRNRVCGRSPFGIQTKESEPGTETAPCTQAVRVVKPLQGKIVLTIFKNITIQKYHQHSDVQRLISFFIYLTSAVFLLYFPLVFHCFHWKTSSDWTVSLYTDRAQRLWCRGDTYELLCTRLTAGVCSCLKSPSEFKYWPLFARHCSVLK